MNAGLSRRTAVCALSWLASGALLGGCATPQPIEASAQPSHWSGRFSLTVHSEPPQSWSAGFDLRGDARAGELTMTAPLLDSTLATVRWNEQGAELLQGSQRTRHASLDDLTTALGGAVLPVAALFDWLAGRQSPASGWEADLSRHADGRITARRLQLLPGAELRLILQP